MIPFATLLLQLALQLSPVLPLDKRVDDLPLIERQAPGPRTSRSLVVLLSGDGGFTKPDKKVADALVAKGAFVVALDSRAYLETARTPDEVAADIARVMRHYLAEWKLERVVLLGYSRGADLAPFVVARLPDDLRGRIDLVAMLGLSIYANFHFHWIDLVRDIRRPDDLPTGPELTRLRGLNAFCVYGAEETDSGCRAADPAIVTRYSRPGGHRLTGGFDAVADLILPFITGMR
jgi:type IV secretory pathway VirJ component